MSNPPPKSFLQKSYFFILRIQTFVIIYKVMNFKRFILLFASAISLSGAALYNEGIFDKTPKKELDTTVLVSLKDYKNLSKEAEQNLFFNELIQKIGFNFRNISSFDYIANILELKVNKDDIPLISSFSTINYVDEEKSYVYNPSDPQYSYYFDNSIIDQNYSYLTMNGDESENRGKNTLVAVLDTSLNFNHVDFEPLDSTLVRYRESDISRLTSNEEFHAKDYKYINSKIPFVYDYCNADNDVLSKETHGTHVSSLAVANGPYEGIAPNSQLAFMKVFNDYGSGCTSSVYLKALEDCAILDVDAINMSFGSALNYTLSATDKAVNEVIGILKNQGTQVFIAGGNDGRDVFLGSDYEYSPLENVDSGVMGNLALSSDAITVGNSSTNEDITNVFGYTDKRTIPLDDKILNSVTSDENGNLLANTFEKEYSFYDFIDGNQTFEYVVVPNYGDKNDYKGIDAKGKIVVVDRGVLPFTVKIYYALKAGASGLLIANGSGEEPVGAFDFEITDDILKEYPDLPYILKDGKRYFDTSLINMPVATISYESGLYLKENENKTISFGKEAMSLSSSMGNGIGLELKPDIVAPGSNVFGALSYDSMNNEYVNDAHYCISGTSMATPNLMGAYSTILSNYNNINDTERDKNASIASKKMLSNTTLLLDEYGSYLSPRKQGSGLVNIKASSEATSYLTYGDKSKIELKNDDLFKNGHLFFNLNLVEEKAQVYDVSLVIMAPRISKQVINGESVKAKNSDDIILNTVNLGKFSSEVGDNLYNINYSLLKNERDYLKNFENGTVLEGYVIFKNNEHTLNIPYLGFYGEYDKAKPYEDFSFEKDENKVYESDIMNDFISTHYNVEASKVETGSYILLGNNEDYYKKNILNNKLSLTKQYDLMQYIYDDINHIYHIYTGDYSNYDGILIQLFMARNVIDNKVTIYDQNKNLVYDSYFEDNLISSDFTRELYRNVILEESASLISEKYYTHRSYLSIPLFNEENNKAFQDGVYTLRLQFTLGDNSLVEYNYKIHFNEEFISVPDIYNVTLKDNVLRIFVKEREKMVVNLNGENITDKIQQIDDINFNIEIDLNDFEDEDYIFLTIVNANHISYNFKFDLKNKLGMSGLDVKENYFLNLSRKNSSSYGLSLCDEETGELIDESLIQNKIKYFLPKMSNFINIYALDGSSKLDVNFISSIEAQNELIEFESPYTLFEIEVNMEPFALAKILSPILITIGVLFVIGVTVFLVLFFKQRKDENNSKKN